MTSATADQEVNLRVLHAVPGRARVHMPDWTGNGTRTLENGLREVSGVLSVRANAVTGNVVITFDPRALNLNAILATIRQAVRRANDVTHREPALPPAHTEHRGDRGRARIAVRGLDTDPRLARQVSEGLKRWPGVAHVSVSQLTGRVLIEYDRRTVNLDDLLAHIAQVELPDVPEEDRPAYPLDPSPLIQSAARSIGAGLGLSLLGIRHLAGIQESPGLRTGAARVSATIGIMQGFPAVRYGLRRLVGRDAADLLIHVPGIISLALAGSTLGLLTVGAESLRLLTEVVARRKAWRRYEERLQGVAGAEPGATIRVENGERTPFSAFVMEGIGTATGQDGSPLPVAPGVTVSAGARLFGGPFVLCLEEGNPFTPQARTAPESPSLYSRYGSVVSRMSLGFAALAMVVTRSLSQGFASLLLISPRTALIGLDSADTGASARVLRAGVTVVGTRPDRSIRLPHVLLIDGARCLTDGFERTDAVPVQPGYEAADILKLAADVATAAGAPWGGALVQSAGSQATDASFDGRTARASIDGLAYTLGAVSEHDKVPARVRLRYGGEQLLVLRAEGKVEPLGFIGLRARLAMDVAELVNTARRHGVELALLSRDDPLAARVIGQRAGVTVRDADDVVTMIQSMQANGSLVAYLSDNANAGPAFAACDLAIGLSSGRSSRFPARADLLAPDLTAVAAILEAGKRRDLAVRDSVILSALGNIFGAVWGIRGRPGVARASQVVYVTALGSLISGWLRLRGGERSMSSLTRLVDPRPERWGRRAIADVVRTLHTDQDGLTSEEAAQRRQVQRPVTSRNSVLQAVLQQLRSPLTGILAAGGAISIVLGSTADVIMIGATIAANALVSAWQERQAGQAVAALQRIGSTTSAVLRDGQVVTIPTGELVLGDVIILAPGMRVAADARVISANDLEVDEAALTGESFPVVKMAEGGTDAAQVVLAGTDITVGTGRAVVFAVGNRTRLGATAAALAIDETRASPLGIRLNRMLRQVLPLAGIGGLVVFGSGVLRGAGALSQLAIGAAIAIAAVPEGLPLLAGVGEAAVARRLAGHGALVRRLSAVEALGRVDVACTDKTGTLTEGRLALQVVATPAREETLSGDMERDMRQVILSAALATPHPDAIDASAHTTDVAVRVGAQRAGVGDELLSPRQDESPFEATRPYHATIVNGTFHIKGAVEEIEPRCERVWRDGASYELDDAGRQELLARASHLAERGLRVLMVANGPADASVNDPRELTALGFVGIADPLRADVPDAVRRCHEAGVRVVMLTGDHPATARAIAREAGLLNGKGSILTGADLAALRDDELDQRLEDAVVVARVTPLDKLRIVESLQRSGHTVAMTGDGVNDGPALRLADVGVAMGQGGTEVARQAAAIVLADDDFSTLVEALVEGRSFWRNIRRALGLLLGGNLGELGLMVGASVMGLASPLVTRQILAVNLVTDVLPSLAVALQPPESRVLSALAREGTAALDKPLRNDVLKRGGFTAVPSLVAYLLSLRASGLAQARSVAFASVVTTQLAQTLDVGRTEGALTRSVLGAVVGSSALLVASLTLPPLQTFLSLTAPTPFGWMLIAGGSIAAVALSRLAGHGLLQPAPAGRLIPTFRNVQTGPLAALI